jgi:PilZ domain-containing protein
MRVRGKDRLGIPFDETTQSAGVSQGGCSFHSSHEMETGSELELEFHRRFAAHIAPAPFLTTGEVLRVVVLAPERFEISVRFTGPHFPSFSSEAT